MAYNYKNKIQEFFLLDPFNSIIKPVATASKLIVIRDIINFFILCLLVYVYSTCDKILDNKSKIQIKKNVSI